MVGVPMVDTELAWELADAARGHLDARERNEVYVRIAVGDGFWAVAFLLQTIVRAGLAVRSGLLPKLFRWVTAYDDHPEQAHLRYLVGHIRIQPQGVPVANSTAGARIGSATNFVQQPGLATLTVRRPRPAPSQGVGTNDDLRRR